LQKANLIVQKIRKDQGIIEVSNFHSRKSSQNIPDYSKPLKPGSAGEESYVKLRTWRTQSEKERVTKKEDTKTRRVLQKQKETELP